MVKYNFKVDVLELPNGFANGDFTRAGVEVDPREHQAFQWVKQNALQDYNITSRTQLEVIQIGFELRREDGRHR